MIGFCFCGLARPPALVPAFYTVHSRVLTNARSFFQLVCLQLSSAPDPVLETVSGIFHSSDIFFQRKILRIGGSPWEYINIVQLCVSCVYVCVWEMREREKQCMYHIPISSWIFGRKPILEITLPNQHIETISLSFICLDVAESPYLYEALLSCG